MRVISAELYSLPIDNTYSNVFDDSRVSTNVPEGYYDDSIRYAFQRLYEFYEIPFQDVRAFNISQDTASIVLNLPIETVKKYNYIIFKSTLVMTYFFFITNVSSTNSNTTRCTIEYDIWTNNLYKLHTANYPKKQFCYRKTMKRFYIDNDGNLQEVIQQMPAEGEPDEIRTNFSAVNQTAQKYNVLWARYSIDKCYKLDSNSVLTTNENVSDKYGTFIYVFFPIEVYDFNGTRPYKNRIVGTCISEKLNEEVAFYDSDVATAFNVSNEAFVYNSANIAKIDLTFNPPFDYTCNRGDDGHFTVSLSGIKCTSLFICSKDAIQDHTKLIFNERQNDTTWVGVPCLYGQMKDVFITQTQYNRSYNKTTIPALRQFTVDADERVIEEPFFNFYPFSFYSLLVDGKIYNITGVTNDSYFRYKLSGYGEGTQFGLEITDQGVAVTDIDYLRIIVPNGTLPLWQDKYDTYMRENGESFRIGVLSNLLSNANSGTKISGSFGKIQENANVTDIVPYAGAGAIGGLPGIAVTVSAKAVLNSAMTVAKMNATIKDLQNARDNITLPSTFANISGFQQDRVLVIDNKYKVTNNIYNILNTVATEGWNISRDEYFFTPTRVFFDYVQTDNVQLPCIYNIPDRIKLQNIFNNGVRIWHLENFRTDKKYYDNSEEFYNALLSLNPLVHNVERDILTIEPEI